jgi:hypothetical protein
MAPKNMRQLPGRNSQHLAIRVTWLGVPAEVACGVYEVPFYTVSMKVASTRLNKMTPSTAISTITPKL